MALSSNTYQFINQLGVTRLIDATQGPDGPHGTVSYLLIGANGWHNGQRLPHDVVEDLAAEKLSKQTVEGVEYFLVPETSSNLPGTLSHYAQRTGVADLENPPGGGVNAVRQHVNAPATTADPDGVSKYVADSKDSHDEARDLRNEQNAQVDRAVRAGEGSPQSEAPASPKTKKTDA